MGSARTSCALSLSWALSSKWRRMRASRSTWSSAVRAGADSMRRSFYRESSRGERVAYPFDLRGIDVIEQDDVEPAGSFPRSDEVVPCGRDDTRLLAPVDTVRCATESLRAAQPDLREYQRVAVPENEVDLSPAGAVAALDHDQALALQIRGGDALCAIAGVHFALSSGTPTPSRNTAWTGSRWSALPPRYETFPVTPSRLIVCCPASSWAAMRQESMPSA